VTGMQVVATAGHVDHGKSTLVRALTGMEPDRWAEERRRGLTIDLGFAWMDLPGGQRLAFVDVPGHERFVPNMLAGLGPVPAVLMVVAADGGWMPQSAEHLAAIDALGISRGLLVLTRSDLADPGPARRRAAAEIAATSLGAVEAVAVSAVTGAGLPELRGALARLAAGLPVPDPGAPVRLWVDRAFSIKGSGTVVTGTLPAGTVRTGDELLLTPSLRPVRVRAIESMDRSADQVHGVARVGLNLRGVARDVPARGMALVQPGRWTLTSTIDVRSVRPAGAPKLPRDLIAHTGSARTPVRVRLLGEGPSLVARLTLRDPLPLHAGDRVLLRDPGAAEPFILGATVLDVAPPPLRRRGAAAAAAQDLARWPDPPGARDLLRRHGLLRTGTLAAMGVTGAPDPVVADWLADGAFWAGARDRLAVLVAEHAARDPLSLGVPVEAARAALGLPDRRLAEALAAGTPAIAVTEGYLQPTGRNVAGRNVPGREVPGREVPGREVPAREVPGREVPGREVPGRDVPGRDVPGREVPGSDTRPAPARATAAPVPATVPEPLARAVRGLRSDLAGDPFRAPEADRLRELGLDARTIAAAARAGLLLRISEQVVLAPGADADAATVLAALPQPFSTAEARKALGTTRRVAIPLLEFLDRARITERLPDDRRRLRSR
jgi:selenocysteine-specific elongation factor